MDYSKFDPESRALLEDIATEILARQGIHSPADSQLENVVNSFFEAYNENYEFKSQLVSNLEDAMDIEEERNLGDVEYSLPQGIMEFQDKLDDFGLDLPLADDGEHYLEWHSDAGEDMIFDFEVESPCSLSELCDIFSDMAENFDVSEHVSLWAESAGRNGVPDIETLVDDAKEQKRVLEELAKDLREICNHTIDANETVDILKSDEGICIVYNGAEETLSFYNSDRLNHNLQNIEVNGIMSDLDLIADETYTLAGVKDVDISNMSADDNNDPSQNRNLALNQADNLNLS